MRFQYMSDLHLEMAGGAGFEIREITAPHLILAGDIGDPRTDVYRDFIRRCSASYETVFVVLGNHEFYGMNAIEAPNAFAEAGFGTNVRLLNCTRHDFPTTGFRVVGATLWSEVPPDSADVQCFIQDYRRIMWWSVGANNAAHLVERRWLDAEITLAEADGVRLVVVTHHAPLLKGTSRPEHEGGPLNCAFASDLRSLLRPPVCAWIHGHTHHSHVTRIGDGVVLTANQRGYPGENGAGFVEGAFVEV